jgi:hypothetical protein
MSDNLNDKKKYDAIKPDSIIQLNINSKFYNDLRGVFLYYVSKDRSTDEIAKIMENISAEKVTSEEEYPLYVLFEFMAYLQAAAKQQGLIIKQEVPDINEEFPENPHSETPPSE